MQIKITDQTLSIQCVPTEAQDTAITNPLSTVPNIVPAIIQQPKTEHWSLQSCSLILSVTCL